MIGLFAESAIILDCGCLRLEYHVIAYVSNSKYTVINHMRVVVYLTKADVAFESFRNFWEAKLMRSKHIFTTLICLLIFVCLSVVPLQDRKALAQSGKLGTVANQQVAANPNLSKSQEIGLVYEAFLSPQQEPGEEENTPKVIPAQFRSTAPSVSRNQRKSKGYGVVKFTKDLSKALVNVQIEGINTQDINMFHIHCGNPDVLGPILVDFALATNLRQNFADNIFSVEVTNENIEKTLNSGRDILGAYLLGCPIESGKLDKIKTVAGMEQFAKRSELYFNLHTKGQTFFGDIRGKLQLLKS